MISTLLAALLAAAVAQAEPNISPLDAATASRVDKPLTVADAPVADEQVQRVLTLLSGQFESKPNGDQPASPALHIGAAVVPVEGVIGGRAVLMQISPLGRPAEPVRVALLHPYKRQGQLRLRVFDLVGGPGYKDAMAGLWAAPGVVPKLSLSTLAPSVDLPLTPEGDGFAGTTQQPVPTTRDGAIEMTSSLSISPAGLEIADAGFDENGKQVWGVRDGQRLAFSRSDADKPAVTSTDQGLTVITLVPPAPDATKLQDGGELTAHYTGWLTDGTRFDTSRQPGREPFKIRLPGPVIKGWNEGLKGIAVGERRRLIVPWAMAYGERGRGSIPPKATLIFDVECLAVNNQPPAGLTPPPIPPAKPGGTGGTGGAGGSGGEGGAIGKPPTNAAPEKPR